MGMLTAEQRQLLTDHFSQYISDHKKVFMEKVLADRTRAITVVMEDVYQSQNVSAVIRTCECMGVQDVHIIETSSKYSINPRVLKGSNKWLDLMHYKKKNFNNTEACYRALREKGYKIVVTDPSPECISIHEIPIHEKLAVVMGNELKGTTGYALEQADVRVKIPMFGFTESLNISVSAAICLSVLMSKLRTSGINWCLSTEEKEIIRLEWYRKVVRRSNMIEKEFFQRLGR